MKEEGGSLMYLTMAKDGGNDDLIFKQSPASHGGNEFRNIMTKLVHKYSDFYNFSQVVFPDV